MENVDLVRKNFNENKIPFTNLLFPERRYGDSYKVTSPSLRLHPVTPRRIQWRLGEGTEPFAVRIRGDKLGAS